MKTTRSLTILLLLILFTISGKAQIVIENNGDIGIGTSNPNHDIDMEGNTVITVPSYLNTEVIF